MYEKELRDDVENIHDFKNDYIEKLENIVEGIKSGIYVPKEYRRSNELTDTGKTLSTSCFDYEMENPK